MKNERLQLLQKPIRFLKKHFFQKHPDLPYYLLILLSSLVFIISINVFVELTDEILENSTHSFDAQITNYILSFRSPGTNTFFKIITNLGDFSAYLIGTIIVSIYLFWKFNRWKFTLQLIAITILSALSNVVIKKFVGRSRPGIEHLVVVESLSYPSGHTMCATAFYGFLIYLSFQVKMSKWLRIFLCVLFAGLIFLIGLSRIYLGVHFPTDVAGGFIAGIIWLAFCIVLFNIASLYRRRNRLQNKNKHDLNEKYVKKL